MSKTFLNYISRFFYPESTEVNVGIFKVKYGEGLRKDAVKFVNALKSKRVLFASLEHELWMYVFASLKDINRLLTEISTEVSFKGPNDLSQTIGYLIEAVSYYLAEYETSYITFMRSPSLRELSEAHRERNWPELSDAANDLIHLRGVIHYAVRYINEFANNGKVKDWEEPNFHIAKYWIRYAEGRKICPSCGYNLYYSRTGRCPKCNI